MNGRVPIDGVRVKRLAFFQLSAAQIAACLGCDADLILSNFAAEYRQGQDLGKAMLLQSLMLSAVKHQNVPAQMFLAQSVLGMSSEAMLARQRVAREEKERGHEAAAAISRFLSDDSEGGLPGYADAAAQELAEKEGKERP